MVINTYMLTIKRTTLLPSNCNHGISVLAKNEVVLILIPRHTVFPVYRPTLLATITIINAISYSTV